MRVEYTLPGIQATRVAEGTETPAGATGPSGPSFRSRLRRLATNLPISWRQQLRLNQAPVTASFIGPPKAPGTLEQRDVASERLRWRNMIGQHSQELASAAGGHAPTGANADVGRMLALFTKMQAMEDDVISRHLSETRG